MPCAPTLLRQLEDLAAQCFYAANDRDRIKLVRAPMGAGACSHRLAGPARAALAWLVVSHPCHRRRTLRTNRHCSQCSHPHPLTHPPTHATAPQVLADLGKTAGDFRQLATKGLDGLCAGLMPRLRPALDEAAAAYAALEEGHTRGKIVVTV